MHIMYAYRSHGLRPGESCGKPSQHGVSLPDGEGALWDPLAVTVEDKDASGELLVVVYTEAQGEFRLISARRASRKERKAYEG